MSFQNKILESEGGLVRYVTATEQGRRAWFFVRLFPEYYSEYKKLIKSNSFSLKKCGEILASGWGEAAPDDILQDMKKRYDVKS